VSIPDSATYSEASEQDEPRNIKLAHVSIEVGHFYMKDLLDGEDLIRAQFHQVEPWVKAAVANVVSEFGPRARVSTCFLIDDYFGVHANPAEIMKKLLRIADECGVSFDYVAREAGCHEAEGVPLAELTAAMLLPEPPVGTNGSRPPLEKSGWLCNGERSADSDSDQAMQVHRWRPPVEFGKRNHSIFVDVELWNWKETVEKSDGHLVSRRIWSCPFLAAVWHLLRLGMLRHLGEPVAVPQLRTGDDWPEHWSDLPAVIQRNPNAAPFAAYRTVSILPRSYLPIENAVDVILGHLDLEPAVVDQVIKRGREEGLAVPKDIRRRVSHIFVEDLENGLGTPNADPG
jgi:hypothetical protein